jgi:hypothetical protein
MKMKLPKMEKMLSQKAGDIEEAHSQAASKISQLQLEGRCFLHIAAAY